MNKITPSEPAALPSPRHRAPPEIVYVSTDSLKLEETDTKGFTDRDLKRTRRVVGHFQTPLPLLVGKDGTVLASQLLWLAAVANKVPEVPVVEVRNLSRLEERMLSAALARVGELGKWKLGKQRALLVEIMDELPAFDLENLAFDMGEIDVILEPEEEEDDRDGEPVGIDPIAVAKRSDIFQLGRHRIGCGDATDLLFYGELMAGRSRRRIHGSALRDEDRRVRQHEPQAPFSSAAGRHKRPSSKHNATSQRVAIDADRLDQGMAAYLSRAEGQHASHYDSNEIGKSASAGLGVDQLRVGPCRADREAELLRRLGESQTAT